MSAGPLVLYEIHLFVLFRPKGLPDTPLEMRSAAGIPSVERRVGAVFVSIAWMRLVRGPCFPGMRVVGASRRPLRKAPNGWIDRGGRLTIVGQPGCLIGDPWLSVPASRQVWLYRTILRICLQRNGPICQG